MVVGLHLEPDCLAMHTARPLFKPEPRVSSPKTDLGHLFLPNMATLDTPPLSASHYYLSL